MRPPSSILMRSNRSAEPWRRQMTSGQRNSNGQAIVTPRRLLVVEARRERAHETQSEPPDLGVFKIRVKRTRRVPTRVKRTTVVVERQNGLRAVERHDDLDVRRRLAVPDDVADDFIKGQLDLVAAFAGKCDPIEKAAQPRRGFGEPRGRSWKCQPLQSARHVRRGGTIRRREAPRLPALPPRSCRPG